MRFGEGGHGEGHGRMYGWFESSRVESDARTVGSGVEEVRLQSLGELCPRIAGLFGIGQ